MTKIKIETPKGEDKEKDKNVEAAGGCVNVIVGLLSFALAAYGAYLFLTA